MKKSSAGGTLTSGENISFWIDTVKPGEFETLSGDITTDVLVIGGGIPG